MRDKTRDKTNRGGKETRMLSFVGGLVFFSVVAVLILNKDEALCNEIQAQTKSLLTTSKKALQQFQSAVTKIGKLTEDVKSVRENSKLEGEGVNSAADRADKYDSLWEQVERQASR